MRVAISAWFWNRPATGSGQYVRCLVEHLANAAADLELILVCPADRLTADSVAPAAVRFQPMPPSPRVLRRLRKVWFEQVSFPQACRALRVDLAHIPYWASPLAIGVPSVVTIHDLIPLVLPEYHGGVWVRLYTALVSESARRATWILTDSHSSKSDIVSRLRVPGERVQVAYLAAGEVCARPQATDEGGRQAPPGSTFISDSCVRTLYHLPEQYVLYLGGFDVRKNLANGFAAYHRAVRVVGTDCPLVVAGQVPTNDTAFEPDPRRLAREADLQDRSVRFIGFVDDAHKPALYRGAKALLFPSSYEGFGLPPVEAMSCGTPVIGSRAASLPEVVGTGGLLFDPDDIDGMGDAIAEVVMDESLRARLSQQAREEAARFSWDRTARHTLAAYESARRLACGQAPGSG
jgi:glycosyltransferase involved in cell wall biosynthesis